MDFIRDFLWNAVDKARPHFLKGGKLSKFHSLYDGVETFLFAPSETSKREAHIHDPIDSKRTMIVVVMALVPALLFGIFNVGYQHYLATGQEFNFFGIIFYGLLAVLPIIIVANVVGLGIEIAWAQFKGGEVHEGFLVTGFIIPLIMPIDTPLWMIALAVAFAVIFVKEIFGGTGMNIFNVAIAARLFLFFAYPKYMSGDQVWVRTDSAFGFGGNGAIDAFSGATPLGQLNTATDSSYIMTNVLGQPITILDSLLGLIPGSIGETSMIAIALGAILLLVTKIASWKIMVSVFTGGALLAFIFNCFGPDTAMAQLPWYKHLMMGGFAFGAVFMATDPVTAARTETGKWIYGFMIGMIAILIRVMNLGYPEGMMFAIFFMNMAAPLIDKYVVEANIKKRLKRKPVQA